jgi:hypothetical protein
MKTLMIFVIGLLFSMSARSQILKPVKWSYAAKKTSATTATIFIKATMEEGWHIYGLTVPEGGPVKTTFTFTPSNVFSTIGTVTAPKPTVKFEKTFSMNVNYFEKEVIFQQKVKLKGTNSEIQGTVEFMVCSDRQCLPPETTAFSIPIK